LPEGGEKMMEQ